MAQHVGYVSRLGSDAAPFDARSVLIVAASLEGIALRASEQPRAEISLADKPECTVRNLRYAGSKDLGERSREWMSWQLLRHISATSP